jgi:hypothetical protein
VRRVVTKTLWSANEALVQPSYPDSLFPLGPQERIVQK